MPSNEIALAELQSEIWAMEPRRLAAFLSGVANQQTFIQTDVIDGVTAPVAAVGKSDGQPGPSGGVAVIPIRGILMNSIPKWFSYFGIDATSYSDIVSQVRAASINDDVTRIHLAVDSPGGTVAGVHEASEAIFAARKTKQVTAHINDLGASAAYWLASQAETISAGPNAEAGSIGVFSVYVDSSKRAEEEGFKVHIVRSGEHKGMGVPGAPITDGQLASEQAVIDGMAANFIQAVARGRGKSEKEIRLLATGEIWIAKTAMKNGLVDSVIGGTKTNRSNNPKGSRMESETETTVEPKVDVEKIQSEAAKEAVTKDRERLSAMQKEFEDDLEFAVEQHVKGSTLIEAKAAYCDLLREQLAEEKKKNSATDKNSGKNSIGANPIGHTEGGDNNASGFMDQARTMAKEEKISMTVAIRKLRKSDPVLYDKSRKKN